MTTNSQQPTQDTLLLQTIMDCVADFQSPISYKESEIFIRLLDNPNLSSCAPLSAEKIFSIAKFIFKNFSPLTTKEKYAFNVLIKLINDDATYTRFDYAGGSALCIDGVHHYSSPSEGQLLKEVLTKNYEKD